MQFPTLFPFLITLLILLNVSCQNESNKSKNQEEEFSDKEKIIIEFAARLENMDNAHQDSAHKSKR